MDTSTVMNVKVFIKLAEQCLDSTDYKKVKLTTVSATDLNKHTSPGGPGTPRSPF